MKQAFNKQQAGVGLIEVMISAFVLGIGLLGVLTLQAKTMQYNQHSYMQSQATFMAQDMAERIQANRSVADNYRILFGEDPPGVAANVCLNADCTPEEIADWDLAHWRASLAAALPQGTGEIQEHPDNPDLIVVSVRYNLVDRDEADGQGGGTESVDIVFQL